MAMDRETEKREIESKLSGYFAGRGEIDAAILFGSFASGRFRPGSDVDVAVHSKSPLSPEALADLRTDLSVLCRREVDLADLSRAEGMFLLQIMTKGERVKFDHAVYHRYVMKALGYREDFLPIQRACWDESVRRLIDGQGPASS